MKRQKRMIQSVALLCCLGFLLTACGNSRLLDPKNPISLEIWHYYTGPQKMAFDQMTTEFNETVGHEKGIIVEAFNQGNVNELAEKVMDAASKKAGAEDVPDAYAAYADTAYELDQMGMVASLDPYLSKEELAEYKPEYIEEGRFDQDKNLKIFPIAKSTEVFMLNQTDWEPFAQATGASLEDLATMEGITQTAEKYYDWTASRSPDGKTGKAFFGRDAMANYAIIGARQQGVEILSVEGGKVKLNLDKKVFRKLWDNYYQPYVKGYFTAEGRFRSDDIKVGNLIALVSSTTGAAYFPDKVNLSDTKSYPVEVIALPAPCFAGGEPFAVQQGAGIVVSKSTKQREYAATVFLKWFTETERNIEFSTQSGYLPVKVVANQKDSLDRALQSASGGEMAQGLRVSLQAAFEMVQNNTFYTTKAFKNGTQVREILDSSMSDQAKMDRELVCAAIEKGASREEALSTYLSEGQFETWFAQFSAAMTQAVS